MFESQLIDNARKLNDIGMKKLLDTSFELLIKEKYRASPSIEDLLEDMKIMEKRRFLEIKRPPLR